MTNQVSGIACTCCSTRGTAAPIPDISQRKDSRRKQWYSVMITLAVMAMLLFPYPHGDVQGPLLTFAFLTSQLYLDFSSSAPHAFVLVTWPFHYPAARYYIKYRLTGETLHTYPRYRQASLRACCPMFVCCLLNENAIATTNVTGDNIVA